MKIIFSLILSLLLVITLTAQNRQIVFQLSDYYIDSSGSNIKAWAKEGKGLSDIIGTDFRTVAMQCYTTLCPNLGVHNAGGGWVAFGSRQFILSDVLDFAGWEGGGAPTNQFRFTGSTLTSKLVQNNTGKDAIRLSNNINIYLENFSIGMSSTAGSCLRSVETGANDSTAFSHSIFNNLFFTNRSPTVPAVYLKNFIAIVVNQMRVVADSNSAFIMENDRTQVSYGNSNFNLLECYANNNVYPNAGLWIRSTHTAGRIDHCILTNYYCPAGYYGLRMDDSEDNTFIGCDIEDPVIIPILVGTSDTKTWAKRNHFVGGTALGKNAGIPSVINGTKGYGNVYDLYVYPPNAGTPCISDSSNANMTNEFHIGTEFPGSLNPFIVRASSTIFCATLYDGTTTCTPVSIFGAAALTRQVITSGSSATVGGGNYLVTFDPASVLGSYTLTMPASPTDGQIVRVEFGGTITSGSVVTLTVSPNSGQNMVWSVPVSSITYNSGEDLFFIWRQSNSKWYAHY